MGDDQMKLTNDSYVSSLGTKNFTERYYRDKTGWLKVSARGRKFRMTRSGLESLLPALGVKPNLIIKWNITNTSEASDTCPVKCRVLVGLIRDEA